MRVAGITDPREQYGPRARRDGGRHRHDRGDSWRRPDRDPRGSAHRRTGRSDGSATGRRRRTASTRRPTTP
jgi:hypothetical protein